MKRLLALIVAVSALLALAPAALSAQQPQRQLTPEQQAQREATRQDHQRMLEALKITSLRPGADPNDPQAPNAVFPVLHYSCFGFPNRKMQDRKIWIDDFSNSQRS